MAHGIDVDVLMQHLNDRVLMVNYPGPLDYRWVTDVGGGG
jgi:hypothetical protein